MLEFLKNGKPINVDVDTAKLKTKTEAYLVELIAQRVADIYLARYGEQILAAIDEDELITTAKKHILNTITDANINSGVRDD